MLDHPWRIDTHMVGHHVAGQAQAESGRAMLQVVVGLPSAQVLGNVVALERIGGSDRVVVPTQPLDGARCDAALPQSDQPQPGDTARCQKLQLFVRDLVEPVNVTQMFF